MKMKKKNLKKKKKKMKIKNLQYFIVNTILLLFNFIFFNFFIKKIKKYNLYKNQNLK